MAISERAHFILWILQVVTLFALLSFFLYLSFNPSDPTYTLYDLSVSPTNLTFTLQVSNSNHDGAVSLHDVNLDLCLGNSTVGSTALGSLRVGPGESVWRTRVVDAGRPVWKAVDRGGMEVRVGLVGVLRQSVFGWKGRRVVVRLVGVVPVAYDGSLSDWDTVRLVPVHKKWRLRI